MYDGVCDSVCVCVCVCVCVFCVVCSQINVIFRVSHHQKIGLIIEKI